MRRITHYSLLIIALFYSSLLHAQSRDAGQMVVPRGWENEDSLRWGIFSVQGALLAAPEADSLLNDLEVTFDPEWSGVHADTPFSGKRKGILAYGWHDSGDKYDWSNLGMILQQRIYYPSPTRIAVGFDDGYFWRYNDIHFNPQVKYLNNPYDSNDISAYTEYPKNDSISALTFWTYKNTVSPDTTGEEVSNGNEGRVILGYWDNRNAEQLLRTSSRYDSLPGNPKDTAETFSVTLEFNVDTDSINASGWAGIDTTPLIRLQVLFKKGDDATSGWSVLPFVPFRDANHPSNPGWYKLIDTIITKKIYDSLPDSWRRPDKAESGNPARSWNFKQLHVMINEKPQSFSDRIELTDNADVRTRYGAGSNAVTISTSQHQDSLVRVDSLPGLDSRDQFLLESRVLSTYRATVRVRSLSWQDTVMDKYLYRKPEGDSSWSCNPDGTRGGYDSLINHYLNRWSNDLGSNKPREILFNDNHIPFSPLSMPGVAYVDFMASKFNIHARIREQEHGGTLTTQFRRERLSYDGKPPSIFENQYNKFSSNTYMVGLGLHDYFPSDYLINGRSLDLTQSWPSSQDSMVGLILSRIDASIGGDSLKPYRLYTQYISGLAPYTSSMRKSAYVALRHPKDRRFAIESDIQGWGLMNGAGTANPVYHQRPTTPEETISMFYSGLANGVSAFNSAQGIDLSSYEAQPGAIGPLYRNNPTDPVHLGADFNFGNHRRIGSWDTLTETCETDGVSYPYYLGYANQYRAYKRAVSRINQVYDTNGYNKKYPFKRLEWLDAYSAQKGIPGSSDSTDRSTYLGSFIKAFCTTPVKRWERTTVNGYKQYVDSTSGGNLVTDSAHRTYVEVGMFRDNPGGTLKGFAAMVVNTRLWPSLRDAEDSIYYNQGLDSAKDRSRSTLGDIDTRKAWFRLDTNNFPPPFRSSYYVIRDVWHHDTTFLVHCDSGFGVYMKPGEARLLYIEKGVSIRTAPKAATYENEFAFNNGRRVAEILKGRQSVVTYTRAGKLYVNYPGAGERFEGYNERSAGENIATGYEVCIDSSGTCHRPSICAGMNDTAVAITYWSSESGGRVKVAYQMMPYDAWQFATAIDSVIDTTSDHSGVTPVIAPYADLLWYHPLDSVTPSHNTEPPYKDSIWIVAASYLHPVTKASGIIAFRFKVTSTGIQYLDDNPDQFFHQDGIVHETDRSAFPTITSRAITRGAPDYSMRLAWQKGGRILYNRYGHINDVITSAGVPEVISNGLPSLCYNYHPSIALNCVKVGASAAKKKEIGQIPQLTGPPSKDSTFMLYDYVVWESKLIGNKWNSGTHFWPVMRQRYQTLEMYNQQFVKGRWQSFRVYKPKIDTSGFHWPVVSAGSVLDTLPCVNKYKGNTKAYYDKVRIGWYDEDVDSMEFVHYPYGVKRTILNEGGTHPSLPQPTYYIKRMSDSSMVQPSVAFMGLQKDDSLNHVRITNGWFPMVATSKKSFTFPSSLIIIRPDSINQCPKSVAKIDIGPPTVIKTGDGGTPQINWKATDVAEVSVFPNNWPVVATNPVEFSSDTFRVSALDSIIIPRKLDTLDITSLRNALYDSADYLIQKILLKRHIDSSYVGTIDSIFISKGAARYPGSGLHPTFAKYEYPLGMPTDSVFISIEVIRGDTSNNLERGFIEYVQDDDIATVAFKQAPNEPAVNAQDERIPITMEIYPNPLSLNATVEVVTPHDAQTLIELYDINGKRVSTLFNGSSSGKLTLTLHGKDLTNGIYFLRTQCGYSVVTKKVELIR